MTAGKLRAALRWLATGGPRPLSGGMAAPVDFGGIVHELAAAAETIIYGPRFTAGRKYTRCVEHALVGVGLYVGAARPDRGRSTRCE